MCTEYSTGHFTCHNNGIMTALKAELSKTSTDPSEQHMKQLSMCAYVIVVSGKIIKTQTSCFKAEQVVLSSKSAGMRLCFLSPRRALYFFLSLSLSLRSSRESSSPQVYQLQSCIIISKVLLNPLLLNTRMSSAC